MGNLEFDLKRLKNRNKKIKLNNIKYVKEFSKDSYKISNLSLKNAKEIKDIYNFYTKYKNRVVQNEFKKIVKESPNKIEALESTCDYLMINELDFLLTAYNIKDDKERYEYIYDYICDFLDDDFKNNNLCDFKNDICISRRDLKCKGCKNPLIYGCCYTNGKVCENLVDSSCTIKCLSCKLFTCRYLSKLKVKYKVNDILGLKLFFNLKQKYILSNQLFTDRDEFINILLQKK